MLLFTVPMILGNLLPQCYNIADTLIVGRFLEKRAGGRRLVLYADDLPDLHPAGTVHGQRGAVLHTLWPAR